ncbi:MAG TPA: ACT domain-containing protein [Acidimicrobiales bacterium]|nr:ACT domain-containing protein [Acidimicrobiales bacterium]
METYVVRVWLPDRPGALGAVASRIGAVRGDVVGIDILETGDGVAVDELVVRLPQESLVDLLVGEIQEVDGVTVEDVKRADATGRDPRLDALETAAILCGADTMDELLRALVVHGSRTLGAEWSAVVDLGDGAVRATWGPAPPTAWLSAFVHGARAGGADATGGDDVAWAPLPGVDLALVAGRAGTPFRAKERRQVAALARVAGTRAREVGRERAQRAHPTTLSTP